MSEKLGDAVLDISGNIGPLEQVLATSRVKTLRELATTAKKSKALMTAAFLGVGVAVGVGLKKVADEFDGAFDTIQNRTGATGKKLERLKGDFRKVLAEVPDDAQTTAMAFADVNTRLDLMGKPLRDRTKQFLDLARVTGDDVEESIRDVARALQDWEIKQKDQGKTMDGFLALSQKTGISVGDLARQVVQFGAPLRNFGFDLEQAAAMFAGFEKAGVNMTTTMAGVRLGVGQLAAPTPELTKRLRELGVAAGEPQEQFQGIIAAMSEAETRQEALGIAIDVFGKRAANDMAEAVEQGRFELDDLIGTFRRGEGSIATASDAAIDFDQKLGILRNRGMLALEKPAMMLFDALTLLSDVMLALPQPVLEFIGILGLLSVAVGIAVTSFQLLSATQLLNPWVLAGVAVVAVTILIIKHWDKVKEFLGNVWSWIKNAAMAVFERVAWAARHGLLGPIPLIISRWREIRDFLVGAWRWIKRAASDTFGAIRDLVVGVWNAIRRAFVFGVDKVLGLFSTLLNAAAGMVGKLSGIPIIGEKFEGLADGLRSAARGIDHFRENLRGAERQTKQNERALASLEKAARGRMGRIAGLTEREMRKVRDAMSRGAGKGRDALIDAYDKAIDRIRKAMKQGRVATAAGSKQIEELLKKQLSLYGISNPAGVIKRGKQGFRGPSTVGGHAAGGFTGVLPGYSRVDDRLIAVRGGEAVLRPEDQVPFVDATMRAQHGFGLADMFRRSGSKVPPGFAPGGIVDLWGKGLAHFAPGGMVHPPGTPGTALVNRVIAEQVASWMNRYRMLLTAGYDPGGGHVSPGHNVTGTALDTVPREGWGASPTRLFERGLNAAIAAGKKVLYGSHGVGTAWPNHGWGNHAHTEWGMSGGVGGRGGAAEIHLPRYLADYAQGVAVAEGLNRVSEATEEAFNRALNEMVGLSVGAHGVTDGPIAEIARRMVVQRWGQGQWPPFLELKHRESGPNWDPTITNPSSGAGGIPQALPPSKMGSPAWPPTEGRRSAIAQLDWMINEYIPPAYGTPAAALRFHDAHNWYAPGGFVDLWGTGLAALAGGGLIGGLPGVRVPDKPKRGKGESAKEYEARMKDWRKARKRAQRQRSKRKKKISRGGAFGGLRKSIDEMDLEAETIEDHIGRFEGIYGLPQSEAAEDLSGDPQRRTGEVGDLISRYQGLLVHLLRMRETLLDAITTVGAFVEERSSQYDKLRKARRRSKPRKPKRRKSESAKAYNARLRTWRRANRAWERQGFLMEAVKGSRDQGQEALEEFTDKLTEIQGVGSSMGTIAGVPALGELGGRIHDTQLTLAELRAPKTTESVEPLRIDELMRFAEAMRLGAFDSPLSAAQIPAFHGGGIVDGIPAGTREVIARLKEGEGVIDEDTMRRGLGGDGGSYEFVITNWETGKGYFKAIAEKDRKDADRRADIRRRAGVVLG